MKPLIQRDYSEYCRRANLPVRGRIAKVAISCDEAILAGDVYGAGRRELARMALVDRLIVPFVAEPVRVARNWPR